MYLGLGVILGLLLILPRFLSWAQHLSPHIKARPYLCILLIGFTLFAISNQLGIGQIEVAFPLPKFILKVASILSASARIFWPVYYFIYLFMIYGLCRTFSKRTGRKPVRLLCDLSRLCTPTLCHRLFGMI